VGIGLASREPVDRPSVQRLDELHPHLVRAASIAARLGLERARAAAEALTAVGLPAALLAPDRRVVAANRLFEKLPQIQWRARDRITLTDAAADALFRKALATVGDSSPSPRSLALGASDDGGTWAGHLISIRGTARDIFSAATAMLILTQATLPQAPPVDLVQSLFDLTPAEARVACGIATGATLPEIAAAGGVSHETVRSQLRGALTKTGCARQAQLVALLGGIVPGDRGL